MGESSGVGGAIGGQIPTIADGLRSIGTPGKKPLGAEGKALAAECDAARGFVDKSQSEGERAWAQLFGTCIRDKDKLLIESQALSDELAQSLDFRPTQSVVDPALFEKLAELLIDPTRTPGEPCLAPAPLLRDLLDLALGRAGGELGGIFDRAHATVEDFLFPAFGTAEALADSVQKVLEDPITAALNLILGQRGKIECETVGGVAVGVGVIERQIKRLEDALAEALP